MQWMTFEHSQEIIENDKIVEHRCRCGTMVINCYNLCKKILPLSFVHLKGTMPDATFNIKMELRQPTLLGAQVSSTMHFRDILSSQEAEFRTSVSYLSQVRRQIETKYGMTYFFFLEKQL